MVTRVLNQWTGKVISSISGNLKIERDIINKKIIMANLIMDIRYPYSRPHTGGDLDWIIKKYPAIEIEKHEKLSMHSFPCHILATLLKHTLWIISLKYQKGKKNFLHKTIAIVLISFIDLKGVSKIIIKITLIKTVNMNN